MRGSITRMRRTTRYLLRLPHRRRVIPGRACWCESPSCWTQYGWCVRLSRQSLRVRFVRRSRRRYRRAESGCQWWRRRGARHCILSRRAATTGRIAGECVLPPIRTSKLCQPWSQMQTSRTYRLHLGVLTRASLARSVSRRATKGQVKPGFIPTPRSLRSPTGELAAEGRDDRLAHQEFSALLAECSGRSVLVATLRRHHAQAPSRDPLSNWTPHHATLLGSLEAPGQRGPPQHRRNRLRKPAGTHARFGAAACFPYPNGNRRTACICRRHDRGDLCCGDERCISDVGWFCQRQPLRFHRELPRNDDAFICRAHPGHCSLRGCLQGKDSGGRWHCELASAEWTVHQYGDRGRGVFPRFASRSWQIAIRHCRGRPGNHGGAIGGAKRSTPRTLPLGYVGEAASARFFAGGSVLSLAAPWKLPD